MCGSSVAQCPTPCDPMNYSPSGFSVHGIFQARIPEWVAVSYSRGPSWPRDRTRVSCIGRRILDHSATWCIVDIIISCWLLNDWMSSILFFIHKKYLFKISFSSLLRRSIEWNDPWERLEIFSLLIRVVQMKNLLPLPRHCGSLYSLHHSLFYIHMCG